MFGFSSGKKKKKNALNISLEIISIPFNIELFFSSSSSSLALGNFFPAADPSDPIANNAGQIQSFFNYSKSTVYISKKEK
jgi:hypothetical protein